VQPARAERYFGPPGYDNGLPKFCHALPLGSDRLISIPTH